MKAKEIREMNADEIRERIREEKEQVQQLRFQHAIAALPNPLVLRHKRREIARLQTILKQQENPAQRRPPNPSF